MANESFKVGDKVVPKDPDFLVQGNRTLKVVRVSSPYVYVGCRENGELDETCVIRIEMEDLIPKNGQMTFCFFDN